MKGLMVLLALGLASSDKLDRTYLPPPGAKLSGGNLGAVDAPLELPKEYPSTTIRPRPKYPVRPEDTELTVGINRGQPSSTGAPQGFTSTTRPFASKYIPSTKPGSVYTQTTKPERFGTTASPLAPTEFSSRPGQKLRPVYGPNGKIIGVTSTPASVEVCNEGDARCQQAQSVSGIYGPSGQITGQQVTPTPGSVQGFQPVYGPNGEIISVTPAPGTINICKEGDVRCQKQAQQSVPVYSPSGQIIGNQPSITPPPGKKQSLHPIYGQNGEIIGVTPTPGTVEICQEGDVNCEKRAQQNVPVYGPSGRIAGYQPGGTPRPEILQGPVTQGQQTVPVYGPNGQVVGYQPSVALTPTSVPNIQSVYGPKGQNIGQQPRFTSVLGTVQVCREGDDQCLKQAQQNVPVYDSSGQIVGYQPSVTPSSGNKQSLQPIYGQNGEIIGVTPTPGTMEICQEGDVNCEKRAQQNVPVYGPSGQIAGYKPSVTLRPGILQGPVTQGQQTVPVYGPNGQVVGYQPSVPLTPTSVPNIQSVYGPKGQNVGQQPRFTSVLGTVQVCSEGDDQCLKQAQQNVPVYDSSGQIVGYQPSVTPSSGNKQSFQPIYGQNGEIIGVTPTPGTVEICQEGDVNCEKRAQQIVPVYGPSGQIAGYKPSVTPRPGILQGPVTQGQQTVPVYGPNGQVVGYQPSVPLTPTSVPNIQSLFGPEGQNVGQQPRLTSIPGTVQVCSEGDDQCLKQAQQNIPVYDSSGQIVGYQPSVTPSSGNKQSIYPVYGQNGEIIGVTPTPGTVEICQEGDVNCEKKAQQNVPVYGPSGQIISYQPSVIALPGTVQGFQPVFGQTGQTVGKKSSVTPTPGITQGSSTQGLQIVPVYGSNGQIIGYKPSVTPTIQTVQSPQPVYSTSGQIIEQQPTSETVCREGDVKCQKQIQQTVPVYDGSGQIIGYQPSMTPTPVTSPGLRPVYEQNRKIISVTPTPGMAEFCQEGDVSCLNQDKQNVPVYDSNGQIIGYQSSATPTSETSPDTVIQGQPIVSVYSPSGQVIGYQQSVTPTPGTNKGLKPVYGSSGQVDSQQPHRQIYRPNGQIIGQQLASTPGTTTSLQPVYGISDQIIGQQPTEVSPTTRKPVTGKHVTGETNNFYRPGTVKPSVTTPGYFPSSSLSTTPSPFKTYGSTPAGVDITTAGINAERPLAESDKKAVTINYDITLKPEGYSYNFDTSNGIHIDEAGVLEDGNKAVGTYSYIGDDGKEYKITYKADENGFQPTGDHLPTPHPIPAEIQRVIEQATKDKQSGISDDGSYDEAKYGPGRYNQLNHPQSGDQRRPAYSGRKPSKPTHDKEEGYHYTPPKSKFPPRLPVRGQTKRPQGIYEEKSTTPSVNIGKDRYDMEPVKNYNNQRHGAPGSLNKSQLHSQFRPSGEQETDITTYRPTGSTKPGRVDQYGRMIPSRLGQGVGSSSYRPSESSQDQVDKYGKQTYSQPGQEPVETVVTGQVDIYGRPVVTRPMTTYRPVGTTEPSQVDKHGRPIYSQPEEESSSIAEPGQVPPRSGQRYSTTTYRPVGTYEPLQEDKFRKPIYSQQGNEISATAKPEQVDEYGRLIPSTSRPGQEYVDTFGRPIYSQPGGEPSGTFEPSQVDIYGRPISLRPGQEISVATYRPVSTSEPSQVDEFGRPIYLKPGAKPGTAERDQVDEYGRPVPPRPGQAYADKFGRPIYSPPGEEPSGTIGSGQVDKFGRLIPSRPGQGIGSTTYRPVATTEPSQVDKFGRPVYSQPDEKPSRTVALGTVDEYGRPVPSRPRQGYVDQFGRPTESTGSAQLDAFGRPISSASDKSPENAQSDQFDKYGRPLPSRSRLRPSSTTYRPVDQSEPVDEYGRPIFYDSGEPAGSTSSTPVDTYSRPISRPGQGPNSTTYRPISSTQAPEYPPGSDISEGLEQKPEEFGPHEKQGPAYLSPYEDKTGKVIGEDFRGPKQPPRFDLKTGYHY